MVIPVNEAQTFLKIDEGFTGCYSAYLHGNLSSRKVQIFFASGSYIFLGIVSSPSSREDRE